MIFMLLKCGNCGSVYEPSAEMKYCEACGSPLTELQTSQTHENKQLDKITMSRKTAVVLMQNRKDLQDMKTLLEEKFNETAKEAESPIQKKKYRRKDKIKNPKEKVALSNVQPQNKIVAETILSDQPELTDDAVKVWKEFGEVVSKRKKNNDLINEILKF